MYSNIVTATAVTDEMMRTLLKEWGGDWQDPEPGFPWWIGGSWYLEPLDRDPAGIRIHLFFDIDLDYSESEIEELRKLLGAEPQAMIIIEPSREKGSKELKEDFVRDALERFGGICSERY